MEGVGAEEVGEDVDLESSAADGTVIMEGSKPVTCDWADEEVAARIPDSALQVVGRRRDDRLEPEDDPSEASATAF